MSDVNESGAPRRDRSEPPITAGEPRAGRDTLPPSAAFGQASAPAPPPAAAPPPPPGARDTAALRASTGGWGPAPGGAPAGPAPCAGRPFGRYLLVEELGRGGMGVVYKAWHPDLRTHCALKILTAGDDALLEAAARFQREAETSARLRHPGIVTVHDIGVAEGKPYFAMELVEGVGLDRALDEPGRAGLSPPEGPAPAAGGPAPRGLAARDAARVAREVADAIDYAHRQGVIHRDLKPANVLLDRAGRARVVDFGVAKLLARAGPAPAGPRTRTGIVIGTLAYMPPEQADGDTRRIDERTDVYALGALLYEMLAGRPPYQADNEVELLMKVLCEEPQALRALAPQVPADLETIVRKAMEREPARRYPAAGDFAADLDAFLAGRAIRARPATAAYRLRVWVRRRRAPVAVLAVLLALAAGGLLLSGRTRRAEAEKARLRAQVLAALRAKAGRYVDAALTLRRSGVPMDKARAEYLPQLQHAVEEAARADPGLAEPHYYLGRMYRVLMRFGDALAEQDRALAREPDHVASRYERAVLTARACSDRLQRLRDAALAREGARLAETGALARAGAAGAKVELPGDEALAANDGPTRALRQRLGEDLARLERQAGGATAVAAPQPSAVATPDLSRARLACARGLALAYGPRAAEGTEGARRLLAQAIEADATLEEAYEGWARLEEAAGEWDRAIAVYARGLEVDPGFVPFWSGRGHARHQLALLRDGRGADPGPLFEDAAADFRRALDLDPADVQLWAHRGLVLFGSGEYRRARGQEADPLLRAAAADLSHALAADPALADGWLWRGMVHTQLGCGLLVRGEDPDPQFEAALVDLGRALELDPGSAAAWVNRGHLRANQGFACEQRGGDGSPFFAGAVADLGKALEVNPTWAACWERRAGALLDWALRRHLRGQDSTELFDRAADDLLRATELVPDHAETWVKRGTLFSNRALAGMERGLDPAPFFEQALAHFQRGLELNPADALAWSRTANACVNWAQYRIGRGEDPSALFRRGDEAFGRALATNPIVSDAWLGRGRLRLLRGLQLLGRGGDPRPDLTLAVADLVHATELNPSSADAWMRLGSGHVSWAEVEARSGADPAPHYAEALPAFTRSLELNAHSAVAWFQRAETRATWGAWRQNHGQDPSEQYREALRDYAESLALNSALADTWASRGLARANWGLFKISRKEDPGDLLAASLGDFDRALGLNPRSAENLRRRGELHSALSHWADAVRDLEAAVRLNPALEPEERVRLADARARTGAAEPAAAVPAAESARVQQLLEEADRLVQAGRYAPARVAYEEALRRFADANRAAVRPDSGVGLRATIAAAHYNLGCILALASVGKDSPVADAVPLAAADAARLRDDAFAHLDQALDLGWCDREHLARDSDLAPLSPDPRWAALLGRLR